MQEGWAFSVKCLTSLTRKLSKQNYLTTIRPIMDCGCAFWSGGNTTGLKEIQDRFCKTHGIRLLDLQKRFDFLTLILFFKIRSKKCLQYLHNWLPPMFKATTSYNLRSNIYSLPLVSKSSALSCFLPRALMLWNDLPAQVQASRSAALLKKAIKNIFIFNCLSFVA